MFALPVAAPVDDSTVHADLVGVLLKGVGDCSLGFYQIFQKIFKFIAFYRLGEVSIKLYTG